MRQKAHVTGNYKQKNKSFKGASNKNKHKFRVQKGETGPVITKKINKKEKNRSQKRNQLDQLKQSKNEKTEVQLEQDLALNMIFQNETKNKVLNTLKNIKPPRVVVFIPFNDNANAINIKNGVETIIKEIQSKNEEVDMNEVMQETKLKFKFPYFQFFANPKTMQGLVKENFIFTACDRNLQNALDLCKVADIVCPVLSCEGCNLEQTNLNPYENASAFDDFAYRVMTCLRVQGMPPSLCVLQDIQKFAPKKQPAVKKLFQRFFAAEFSENMVTLEDQSSVFNFLRQLQNTPKQLIDWRDQRGYMLADSVAYDKETQLTEVTGFLKGNYMNANQLVHITGYDDYQIQRIEILNNPYKLKLKSKKQKGILSNYASRKQTLNNTTIIGEEDLLENDEEEMENEGDKSGNQSKFLQMQKEVILAQESEEGLQEPLTQIVKKDQNNFKIEGGNIILNDINEEEEEVKNTENMLENDLNNEQQGEDIIEKLVKEEKNKKKEQEKINKINQQQQKNEIKQNNDLEDGMEEEDDDMENDMEDDGSDVSFESNQQDINQQVEEKRQNKFEMEMRSQDEMTFEDEVDYDPNIILKERYSKYQALKSFKSSDWNQYENLPDPYELIYTFKHYSKTKRLALQHAQENAFAYAGFYIKIYIKGFSIDHLQNHPKEQPFILSGLLRHERKMTQVHLKVKRNPEFEEGEFQSKKEFEINLGFRRFTTSPIFSQILSGNTKTKYKKCIKDDNLYLASFYYPCVYGGNALIFDNLENKNKALFALSGDINKVDPMHVILKRVILTGYPHKIHKRRAVIKFMFFNPIDIRYFKPVELRTKLGYKGHILESVGTHGFMKCQFNNGIKQHDVIMVQLYKRVFPKNITNFMEQQ